MSEHDITAEDGIIQPLANTPPRELAVWADDELRGSLGRGLEQSAAGVAHDLGSFARYAEDPEPSAADGWDDCVLWIERIGETTGDPTYGVGRARRFNPYRAETPDA